MAEIGLRKTIAWERTRHYPWTDEDYPQLGPHCVECGMEYPCSLIQLCDGIEGVRKLCEGHGNETAIAVAMTIDAEA